MTSEWLYRQYQHRSIFVRSLVLISKTANHATKENVTRQKYTVVSVLKFGKYAYEVLNVGKATIINFPGNHNALLLTLIDLPFNRMYELQID